MLRKRLSLRSRIFIYMILLVIMASVLIIAVTIFQYREQSIDYNKKRLERKEAQITSSVEQVLKSTTYPLETEYLELIFRDEIYRISDIQNVYLNIYDLQGNLVLSSVGTIHFSENTRPLGKSIVTGLNSSTEQRYIEKRVTPEGRYQSLYIYLTDSKFKPLGILNLPYLEDDTFSDYELREFLERLGYTYVLMLIAAIILAFFMSKYITSFLQRISARLDKTRLDRRNEKVPMEDAPEEIRNLIEAYNGMVDELEESAAMLAKSEREQAWREMAKQVAHEIKNPLTPMRLSVQSFQHRFNAKDPDIEQKVEEYSKTLIQQIDTMSNIAEAFSNFAEMPAQQKDTLNVVEVTRLALDLFNEEYIKFSNGKERLVAKFDRTQLIRVVTNLVKNAIQAIASQTGPQIIVQVGETNGDVQIQVSDNGVGISEENRDKVFEPKFTTKSSGMGLGLAMVKNIVKTYNGSITFTSQEDVGTTFTVTFPKE